jgi:hypothetical protein
MQVNFEFELGSEVEDLVSGFHGFVTAATVYNSVDGTKRYQVQSVVKADGSFVEGEWFDEARLKSLT